MTSVSSSRTHKSFRIIGLLFIALSLAYVVVRKLEFPETQIKGTNLYKAQISTLNKNVKKVSYRYPVTPVGKKANAAIVVLTRDRELEDLINVIDSFEARFNKKYNYPYLVYNDKPFSTSFKKTLLNHTHAKMTFIEIEKKLWKVPKWINHKKLRIRLQEMDSAGVMYGGMLSYHQMCRFFSGTMFRDKNILEYDYYWRLDSTTVRFHCDIDFDPFLYMQERNMVYGFTIALHEYESTCPTLWDTVRGYVDEHLSTTINQTISEKSGKVRSIKKQTLLNENNWLNFFTDDYLKYNGHHFWSNFEIGSVKFFSGQNYQSFFNYLDRSGGFFYERWGDAPVHSLGLGLLANIEQVHWFNEIGYFHSPFAHCPKEPELYSKCDCHHLQIIDDSEFSCLNDFLAHKPQNLLKNLQESDRAAQKMYEYLSQKNQLIDCPFEKENSEIVNLDNFYLCEQPQDSHCLVYSFGTKNSGGLTNYELTLAKKGCMVYVFNQFIDSETMDDYNLNSGLTRLRNDIVFHQITLGASDNIGNFRNTDSNLKLFQSTLPSLRRLLNHENLKIDYLKVDLEGKEINVLPEILKNDALRNVDYLHVEIHLSEKLFWNQQFNLLNLLETLEGKGNAQTDHPYNHHNNYNHANLKNLTNDNHANHNINGQFSQEFPNFSSPFRFLSSKPNPSSVSITVAGSARPCCYLLTYRSRKLD